MLLSENATALVNLHKLYNSLSLFIKSRSNILAYGSKWEKWNLRFWFSVISFPCTVPFLFTYRKRVCVTDSLGISAFCSRQMECIVWLLFIKSQISTSELLRVSRENLSSSPSFLCQLCPLLHQPQGRYSGAGLQGPGSRVSKPPFCLLCRGSPQAVWFWCPRATSE